MTLNDLDKEYVHLITFKKDKMMCPKCQHIFPKLRLPLLTVCPSCKYEEIKDEGKNE